MRPDKIVCYTPLKSMKVRRTEEYKLEDLNLERGSDDNLFNHFGYMSRLVSVPKGDRIFVIGGAADKKSSRSFKHTIELVKNDGKRLKQERASMH